MLKVFASASLLWLGKPNIGFFLEGVREGAPKWPPQQISWGHLASPCMLEGLSLWQREGFDI